MIAGLGVAQPWLYPDLAVSLLYLVAVLVVAWFGGATAGSVAALVAAAVCLAAELVAGTSTDPQVPWWNLAISFPVYLLAARGLPPLRDVLFRDREQSMTDPLTNLGNRRFLREVAHIELQRSKRYSRPMALAYIDLDDFRMVNDGEGFAAGDALLMTVAGAITAALRTSDVVARVAGDEFAVLLPETSGEGARVAMEKMQSQLLETMQGMGSDMTFSIGIVAYEDGPASVDSLLRQSDEVMATVKQDGKGIVRVCEYEHPAPVLV
jgi:diguanylate cyclase (GGDEF)-like protein